MGKYMIVSASRRTDLPCCLADWLMKKIFEGEVSVRNPFNAAQVRRVSLLPEDVDGFVFWTKDPLNLMPHLEKLDRAGYAYYFQFTLTPYGPDIEPRLRDKRAIIDTFRNLSGRIGKERVVWRYDPIFLRGKTDIPWHLNAFRRMADALSVHTEKVIISFIDLYPRIAGRAFRALNADEISELAIGLSSIALERNLRIAACCEEDLSKYRVEPSVCIDAALLSGIIGRPIASERDRNQRKACGCAKSVDIGNYNTCKNGCIYCYAGGTL